MPNDHSQSLETLSKNENVIPPSEVERIIDILPYTPSVENSHTQPSVKNSHTPPSASCGVWEFFTLGCIRKNIYTPGRNVPFTCKCLVVPSRPVGTCINCILSGRFGSGGGQYANTPPSVSLLCLLNVLKRYLMYTKPKN